jgi:hypothetical protein
MKYEREFTKDEADALKHDLLDIKAWIDGMIDGKINNCTKRAAKEYREYLKKSGAETAPLDDKLAIQELRKLPSYKARKEREDVLN